MIRKIGTAVASSQERRRLTPDALTLVSRQQRAELAKDVSKRADRSGIQGVP
jgi:hypothetical protein